MEVLAALSRKSLEGFDELVSSMPSDARPERSGVGDFWSTEEGERDAATETAWMERLGFSTQTQSGDELRRQDPAWGPRVRGVTWHLDGRTVDPEAYCAALRDRIHDRGRMLRDQIIGVRRVGHVWRLARHHGPPIEASRIVLAAGIWTPPLARGLGVRILMQPAKGYHLDATGAPAPLSAGVLREFKIAVTPLGGRVRLAGTLELSGVNHRRSRSRLMQLQRGAEDFLPGLRQTDAAPWCGLRPCTASGLPLIGRVAPDAWIATGHGMMGLTLAPGTASLIGDDMAGRQPSKWAAAFTPRSRR